MTSNEDAGVVAEPVATQAASSAFPALPNGVVESPYFPSSAASEPVSRVQHVGWLWRSRAPIAPTDFSLHDRDHRWTGRPDILNLQLEAAGQPYLASRLLGIEASGYGLGVMLQELGDQPFDYTLTEEALQAEYDTKVIRRQKTSGERSSSEEVPPPVRPLTLPATIEELQLARPHPNAYFSPHRMAWIVCTQLDRLYPMNDQDGGPPTPVCASVDEQDRLDGMATHHAMRRAANVCDPRFIVRKGDDDLWGGPTIWGWRPETTFKLEDYDTSEEDDVRMTSLHTGSIHAEPNALPSPPKSAWWDAWICDCRQVAVVVSQPIPGIFEARFMERFQQSRLPSLPSDIKSASPQHLAFEAWFYIFRIVKETVLFGERRPLSVTGKVFKRYLGFDEYSQKVFETLGYEFDPTRHELVPPDISLDTSASIMNRSRLLRAFLEIAIWLDVMGRSMQPQPSGWLPTSKFLSAKPGIYRFAELVGGLSKTVIQPRLFGGASLQSLENRYEGLGCTPYDPDSMVIRGYKETCKAFSSHRPAVLTNLNAIATARNTEMLQTYVSMERSRGAFTTEDLMDAYRTLDLHPETSMHTDQDAPIIESISDEKVIDAYQLKKASIHDAGELRRLEEATRIIAKHNETLTVMLESLDTTSYDIPMTVERARTLLGISADTDDDMILASYVALASDAPAQESDYRSALQCIADDKDSTTLKDHLSASNAGDDWEKVPVDLTKPVGLRNLGNTCFLNSLLQYLFTIKELREVIIDVAQYEQADTDIRSPVKRVGGRAISRYEISRSRRFVDLLSQLFKDLCASTAHAVTPERELEYLALENSTKSDEEPASAALPAPSTASSETTLVGEPSSMLSDNDAPSPSVLGKRRSESRSEPMEVDAAISQRAPLTARAPTQDDERPPIRARSASAPMVEMETDLAGIDRFAKGGLAAEGELIAVETSDGVTEIGTANEVSSGRPARKVSGPPALPPRKGSSKIPPAKGALLYGRQNDVSECLDAMLFKLEIALDASKLAAADRGVGGSIVKKLFTGRTRQVLQTLTSEGSSQIISDSTDDFNYLLVDASHEGYDLYDALEHTFDEDVVDWDNTKASRRYTAQFLPPLLQIQLQRVQYDTVTKRTFKSNAHIALPPVLCMDRYLDADPSDATAVERQGESRALRRELEVTQEQTAQLRGLTHRYQETVSTLLPATAIYVEEVGSEEPDLDLDLQEQKAEVREYAKFEGERVGTELRDLEEHVGELKGKISSIWSASAQYEYELVSVFMHRGEANFGHYFLYQRTTTEDGTKWLKLNDEQVTEVSSEEVFKDTTGTTLNPYWLCYERKGMEVVDLVQRTTST